ncbi:MAG: hypothetical protein COB46_08435 [Rhodospirillaceae bacterium]|nr:MAG: hypothetical protein COB46_08435 [Rhodospirillaceae bacterium]
MKTLLKMTVATGMITFLAGCASVSDVNDVAAVADLNPVIAASAFNKALAADYAAYAVYEAEQEGEWGHGGAFARKAMRAAKNETVEAEYPTDWAGIPNDRIIVLNKARIHMNDKFARGGKQSHPNFAGRAQGQYDCWVEEEAEGVTDSDCMANHRAAMWRIQDTAPEPMAAAPAPKMSAIPAFVVYFGFDSAKLDALAKGTVHSVSNQSGESKAKRIVLIGHADRSGDQGYNFNLSERRVQAIADALAKRGTAGASVTKSSAGETSPQVNSGDGKREGMNRRVEILLER